MSDPWQEKLPWGFALSAGLAVIILYGYYGEVPTLFVLAAIGGGSLFAFFVIRHPKTLKRFGWLVFKVLAIFTVIVAGGFLLLILTGQILV